MGQPNVGGPQRRVRLRAALHLFLHTLWWLRSPLPSGNLSRQNFEVVQPSGERGYYGGSAAYGVQASQAHGVAFGF